MVHPNNPLALEIYSRADGGIDWPEVATRLENDFNAVWLTDTTHKKAREIHKEAVRLGASPFKLELAKFFSAAIKQTSDGHLLDELSCLANVGKRSVAGIITTNYDLLTEEVFGGYDVFIGQEQLLFSDPQGIAEIYKIHGCCTQSESIVISTKDYETFNQRNAYLAAKLLTVFMEHPIIFLGYSISDPNIQSILKAITDCLSQENLERLKKRFIFIEYSETPMEEPIVRDHTINFGSTGRSLEMTRVELHDYLPFYSELLSRKYEYNPKLLRQLKRDIYQLITTNEPVDRFQVIDIEDDQLENVQVLAGVGISGVDVAGNGDHGHNLPKLEEIYEDIVFDTGNFDLKSLVEKALGYLLKHNGRSVPLHKYIKAYETALNTKTPKEVTNCAHDSLDKFLNDGLRQRRARKRYESWDELTAEDSRDQKIIEGIPLLSDEALTPEAVGAYLYAYMLKNKEVLSGSNGTLKTNLRRVIKIYDWLKYGK